MHILCLPAGPAGRPPVGACGQCCWISNTEAWARLASSAGSFSFKSSHRARLARVFAAHVSRISIRAIWTPAPILRHVVDVTPAEQKSGRPAGRRWSSCLEQNYCRILSNQKHEFDERDFIWPSSFVNSIAPPAQAGHGRASFGRTGAPTRAPPRSININGKPWRQTQFL